MEPHLPSSNHPLAFLTGSRVVFLGRGRLCVTTQSSGSWDGVWWVTSCVSSGKWPALSGGLVFETEVRKKELSVGHLFCEL